MFTLDPYAFPVPTNAATRTWVPEIGIRSEAAMKVIKASPYNGKKGAITNAKKTFGMVSKTVSRVMKGKKVPKVRATGLIKRTIEKAFPRLVKPKPKRRRGGTKSGYTVRKL